MSKIKITENWNNIMCKNMVYFKSGNHKVRIFLSKKNEIKVVIFGDREGFLGDFESIMARIRGYYSTTEKMEELKSMLCKQRKETFYNGISLGLDYSSDLYNSIRETTTSGTTVSQLIEE